MALKTSIGKACGGLTRKMLVVVALSTLMCLFTETTNIEPSRSTSNKGRHRTASEPGVVRNPSTLNQAKLVVVPTKSKRQKPHIIFVVADDLGYNDVGFHAVATGSVVDTPTIDELAYFGVRLENYYVQPTCAPTRASLMTGRYPIRMGIQHGLIRPYDPTCLPLVETTLPEQLRELGYATHAVGKWHLGFSRPACLPTRRGFDSFFGIPLGSATHYTYNFNSAKALYNNESLEWGYVGVHSTELYTQRSVDIIRRHNSSLPLFLYISHQAVHIPLTVPAKYQAGYKLKYPGMFDSSKKSQGRLRYLGLVKALDDSLNVVLEALKDSNLWQNTVLVFTSDNGAKQMFSGNNWPLRGGKNTLWEGGIKAVGFVNSPLLHQSVAGTVQTGLMHVSDWFPTLIEGVAGGVVTSQLPLDGINMWRTIAEGRPSPRHEILHNIHAFQSENTTLSEENPAAPKEYERWFPRNRLPFDPYIRAAIRFGRWKLITGYPKNTDHASWLPAHETGKTVIPFSRWDDKGIYLRLYNILDDPREKNNVATSRRHIVNKLLNRLKFYQANSVAPKFNGKNKHSSPHLNPLGLGLAWVPWLQ